MSKKISKIGIPALMILGIFALWYIHKGQSAQNQEAQIAAVAQNPAFALVATQIDLPALQKHNVPIIIDFGADSCIPCKEMAPVLVKLNAEMQNKAFIKFVDVWKNPQAAKGFPVQVIPTQIIFNADGTPYVPNNVKNIDFTMYKSKDTQEHAFTVHQGGLTEKQMRSILEDMGTN